MTERTLVLIKPDGVARNLIGEVLSRIELPTEGSIPGKDASEDGLVSWTIPHTEITLV